MGTVLQHGVSYLSRAEEHSIMSRALERLDRPKTHHTLDVKGTDHESLVFLENVRRLVNDWLALGDVDIPTPASVTDLMITRLVKTI